MASKDPHYAAEAEAEADGNELAPTVGAADTRVDGQIDPNVPDSNTSSPSLEPPPDCKIEPQTSQAVSDTVSSDEMHSTGQGPHQLADLDAPAIDFVTLGMFILDDIHPPPNAPNQTPALNIPGGAGTYSAIGARIFSLPPYQCPSIGWIIDHGPDFPPALRQFLSSLKTSLIFRLRPNNELTTHGWNGYSSPGHRSFAYLTEKKRLGADDLDIRLLRSKSFHLICGAARCMSTVHAILHRRKAVFGDDEPRPLIIWEPVPDLCTPAEFDTTMKALSSVDVVSPNHEELASLFGFSHDRSSVASPASTAPSVTATSPTDTIDQKAVEYHASALVANGIGPTGRGAIVVRASHEGCYVLSPHVSQWLPAYHTDPSKVVDPTGGGNGFLGGFAVGLVRTSGDLVEAARMGSVSASFCIEQAGLPRVELGIGCLGGRAEKWNGVQVLDRLVEFRNRRVG